MIDEVPGLRGSLPDDGARAPDRSDIGVFAAFAQDKPAVNVVVKRRRGTTASSGDHDGMHADRVPRDAAPREERRPRVYQVQTSASTPGVSEPAPPAGTLGRDDVRAGAPDAATAVSTLPTRRRRARRDPAHAPGEVTRIVFAAAPPVPAATPAEGDARPFEFIQHAEVGYERVMAELQQLRTQLDLALSARRFRIG